MVIEDDDASRAAKRLRNGKMRVLSRLRRVGGKCLAPCLDLAFPPCCAYCLADIYEGSGPVLLCDGCQTLLAQPRTACCEKCGAETADGLDTSQGCPRCRSRRFRFSRVVALGAYDDHLRAAVLRCKHATQETLAAALAALLWERAGLQLASGRFDVVTPIPMFWGRRLLRGANSPEVLAEVLARRLGIPALRMLWRRRITRPQAGLSARARFENLRGAMAFRRSFDCRGRSVLLVDDVMTTGATCHEAALALHRAGAEEIVVAVLARANAPN